MNLSASQPINRIMYLINEQPDILLSYHEHGAMTAAFRKMQIGDWIIIRSNVLLSVRPLAGRAGIKISVIPVDDKSFRVSRVA